MCASLYLLLLCAYIYVFGINAMQPVVVLSPDLLHPLLYFVVERTFVAGTHDAQVFLARALEAGMNGKECDGRWGCVD